MIMPLYQKGTEKAKGICSVALSSADNALWRLTSSPPGSKESRLRIKASGGFPRRD